MNRDRDRPSGSESESASERDADSQVEPTLAEPTLAERASDATADRQAESASGVTTDRQADSASDVTTDRQADSASGVAADRRAKPARADSSDNRGSNSWAKPPSVFVPPRSWRSDLRAIRIVWHRDMIRFWHDRPRIIASALQPMLYLFVFGTGMGAGMRPTGELDLRVFLYPGVMAMATLFTCFFSAGSIVWDREFGFMREMLVAPVRRGAIVIGKALGGATAGMTQGVIVLAIGPLVGVPFSPLLIIVLLAELAVLSFAITSIGVLVAVRIKSFQAFMALVQIIIMPMFFLSGALFPFRNLPGWLDVATRLDPLTYAVDPMRRAVLADIGSSAGLAPLQWGSWTVPTLVELAIVAGTGILALAIAAREFGKVE